MNSNAYTHAYITATRNRIAIQSLNDITHAYECIFNPSNQTHVATVGQVFFKFVFSLLSSLVLVSNEFALTVTATVTLTVTVSVTVTVTMTVIVLDFYLDKILCALSGSVPQKSHLKARF